jgi:tetratricopeptide (TPR) repeat protein
VLKWLADVGAALVRPIEWLFAQLGRAAMAVTERFEGLESILVRIGYVLVWPLLMLWKLLTRVADVLLPRSVRNLLLAPFRALGAVGLWMGHAAMRLAEALNLDGAILWLVKKTRWVWYPFAALAGFFQAWLGSRSYKQLLWGLPAVLIFGPVIATDTWSKLWGQGSIAADYRLAVKQALDDKDFQRVRLYEQKLAQLGVDSQMTDYQTAAALANDGKVAEAYERMQQLAPEDAPGYGPAHSWILQQVLENKLGLSNQETQRLMGVHLKHLQTLGAKGPEVELLRALWLAREKQFVEAAKVLQPLVNRLPPAAVMRMEIDLSLGQMEEARSDARAIRAHMTDGRRRGAKLSALDCRSWAIAEELLGKLDASRDLVRQWLKLEPDNHEARKSLSELCRREFQEILATPDPDPHELAKLFIEAAELTDDPHLLQRQVGFLYRQRNRIPVAQRVVELVAGSPRTQSAILEAAGTAAAEAGNFDQAKTYLLEAVTKDAKNAIAWNNYAFIATQGEKPDYEEALKAVNKALELIPEEFHFRETRGQILVNLGKWKEAIPDLEFAVNGMPTSPEIHLALAKAYEATGEEQLARLHRQQAQ